MKEPPIFSAWSPKPEQQQVNEWKYWSARKQMLEDAKGKLKLLQAAPRGDEAEA